MSTEITVTRAIATQKALTNRIAEASKHLTLSVPTRGEEEYLEVINYTGKPQECEAAISKAWQRLEDTTNVRNAIRAALVKSNAITVIKIGDKEMTIVEALDFRNSLPEREALIKRLKENYTQTNNTYEVNMSQHQARIGQIRSEALNANKKVDETFEAMFIAPQNKTHKPGIMDPLGLRTLIERMTKEVEDFKLNIDYALSESNAVTKITIEDCGIL